MKRLLLIALLFTANSYSQEFYDFDNNEEHKRNISFQYYFSVSFLLN